MKYKSVFDIIGPIMIGPSSSHTAGAARIGRMARTLFRKEPKTIDVYLYGSFASTYRGHGTDVAIIGGILDFDTFDERIPNALKLAEEKGISVHFHEEEAIPEHPNTTKIVMTDESDRIEVMGISIGGGKIEIIELNGFKLKLSGIHPAILVVHEDRFGAIANVTNVLSKEKINIGHMEVSRKEKGQMALMIIETDSVVDDHVIEVLKEIDGIDQVITMID
ncbi:MAG: L-serine ammonia-lyase, iron-sulfur-dependent subunit beta [Bacillaceae bacterium]